MKISKPIKIVGGLLLVVLAISTVLGMVNFFGLTGNTHAPSETGNLLQYEWPQLQGNPSFTRFSAGPAPETSDMLWKANITGIQSSIVAFNGKVFVVTLTSVFALDRTTGNVIWNTTLPQSESWLSVYKIDDAHMVERIYHMEINSLFSQPQVMVDISEAFATSSEALKKHVSQMNKANDFYTQLYDSRTRLRGVQAACDRAEAFTVEIPIHAGPFYPKNNVKTLF